MNKVSLHMCQECVPWVILALPPWEVLTYSSLLPLE